MAKRLEDYTAEWEKRIGPYGSGASTPYDDSVKPSPEWEQRTGPYGCGGSTPYGD